MDSKLLVKYQECAKNNPVLVKMQIRKVIEKFNIIGQN